ncbi:glycosyltransferase [Megalodesulfovibrio paquesii]
MPNSHSPHTPLRLLHVITGLNPGGAETMCVALACALARHTSPTFEQTVVSLLPEGPLAEPLLRAGIPVVSCTMRRAWDAPASLLRLHEALGFFRPHVVQSWMYHADFMTGIALRLRRRGPDGAPALLWGVHNGSLEPAVLPASTRLIIRLLAWASSWIPDAVVSCAQAAATAHRAAGYRPTRWEIIPNGVETDRFRPDATLRHETRRTWGIPGTAPVLGLAARDHPVKDLPTFFRAVAPLLQHEPDLRCVCCGPGLTADNSRLRALFGELHLGERCLLLGPQQDMPRFWNGVDVAVSSSRGEALPLGLAEAMACGVPVVATDVGDTAQLVGSTGAIVPAANPRALGEAIRRMLTLRPPGQLGQAARARILELYSLETCAARYATLYATMAGCR